MAVIGTASRGRRAGQCSQVRLCRLAGRTPVGTLVGRERSLVATQCSTLFLRRPAQPAAARPIPAKTAVPGSGTPCGFQATSSELPIGVPVKTNRSEKRPGSWCRSS